MTLAVSINSLYRFRNMSKKPHTVAFVRQHPKRSMAAQHALAERHGIPKARVYTDLDLCIRQRRRGHGDVVAVAWLPLLADPKRKRAKGGLRQAMMDVIWAFDATETAVLELETMRSTADKAARERLIMDAIDDIARVRSGVRRPGRPEIAWTDAQKATMEAHWYSRKHATDGAALAAIHAAGVNASARQVRKVCGPSGRTPGGSRKR